jgi:hypothetical protein
MNTKIKYHTAEGRTFHTIAPITPTEENVKQYMYEHYNMASIIGYSFRPSVKKKYKAFCNYSPLVSK